MPSQVLTTRRVKRRQQRLRLVSKNAKRKVRSVRKHRKTAKKVMRGGGVIWSQDFSVVDKSPGNAEPKKKFFKLSVSTPLGAAMRKKKFEIKLEFDLNVDTEEKSVRDATVQLEEKSAEVGLLEEIPADLITLIINALSKHISDKSLQFPIVLSKQYSQSPTLLRLYTPNKVLAAKAHKHNLDTNKNIGGMSISKKFMDSFLDSVGNVTKPCVVHMSLRLDKEGKMGLYLDDYTRIIETELNEVEVGKRVVDSINPFAEGPIGKPHDVYEWEQKTIDKLLAVLEPNLTEVELKSKLDELKDKTDNDFIFYRVVHNIKQEEITLPVNVDVSSIPETGTNTEFIFKNEDKFVGTYKKIKIGDLNMYNFKKAEWIDENGNPLEYCLILTDGTYTWKDDTVYKGSYINNLFSPGYLFSPRYSTGVNHPTPQFFKNIGTYTWPNGPTYEGYNGHFIIEFDKKTEGGVYFKNQDKVWSFGFNNGFLTKLPEVGTSPPEVGTSPP